MIRIHEALEHYFGQEEYEQYGDLIQKKLSGKRVSKRAYNNDGTPYEEEDSLPNRAKEIGIDGIDEWYLLNALEGMCRNGTAIEINDSTYEIL